MSDAKGDGTQTETQGPLALRNAQETANLSKSARP